MSTSTRRSTCASCSATYGSAIMPPSEAPTKESRSRPRRRMASWISRPYSAKRYRPVGDRKSTRLNSSHGYISYAVFCLKKKKNNTPIHIPKERTNPNHELGNIHIQNAKLCPRDRKYTGRAYHKELTETRINIVVQST